MDNPNHNIMLENMNTLSVEHKWFERGVKEAIHIRRGPGGGGSQRNSVCYHFHSPTPSGDDVILAAAAATVKSSCVKILSCVIWLQHVNSDIETRIDESYVC